MKVKIAHRIACLLLSLWVCAPAAAHEFWIDPVRYKVPSGENIQADFRNGELFEGSRLGFFDRRSARLEMAHGGKVLTLAPRNGDRPAVNVAPMGDGLHVIVHETTPASLTYRAWEKFQAFADHKDFPDIEARHMARGLPKEGFAESYTRHAKALISVGGSTGQDQHFGMRTEFVALANPYAPDFNDELPVYLYDGNMRRADAQVEIFDKAPDGSVKVSLTRTDADGRAVIAITPGHSYLLDAVILEPSDAEGTVWQSHWAALTFSVPAR